jgi:hypothetical protein
MCGPPINRTPGHPASGGTPHVSVQLHTIQEMFCKKILPGESYDSPVQNQRGVMSMMYVVYIIYDTDEW